MERTLRRRIAPQFDSQTVAGWIKKPTTPREGTAVSVLEWLRNPPHRVGRRDSADYVERAQTLRELGADKDDWAYIAKAWLNHHVKADVAPEACGIATVARSTPHCRIGLLSALATAAINRYHP